MHVERGRMPSIGSLNALTPVTPGGGPIGVARKASVTTGGPRPSLAFPITATRRRSSSAAAPLLAPPISRATTPTPSPAASAAAAAPAHPPSVSELCSLLALIHDPTQQSELRAALASMPAWRESSSSTTAAAAVSSPSLPLSSSPSREAQPFLEPPSATAASASASGSSQRLLLPPLLHAAPSASSSSSSSSASSSTLAQQPPLQLAASATSPVRSRPRIRVHLDPSISAAARQHVESAAIAGSGTTIATPSVFATQNSE